MSSFPTTGKMYNYKCTLDSPPASIPWLYTYTYHEASLALRMLGLSKQGERGDSKAAGVERMQGEAKVAESHQAANNIHPSMQPGGSRSVIGQKVIKCFFCVFGVFVDDKLFVCDVFFCKNKYI